MALCVAVAGESMAIWRFQVRPSRGRTPSAAAPLGGSLTPIGTPGSVSALSDPTEAPRRIPGLVSAGGAQVESHQEWISHGRQVSNRAPRRRTVRGLGDGSSTTA